MVCFVTNHYTAKAFSVLALSIRGLGMYRYLDKRRLLGYDIEGMAAKKHSLLLSHTKESTISLPESFRDKLS